MKISGKAKVNATCDEIWTLIFNPGELLQIIPGCNQVEQVSPYQYHATLTLRVPALAGSYKILLNVLESKESQFCRLAGNACGPGGVVQGTGTFSLLPQARKTIIEYESDIQISGPLAGMHPRFAEGVAQTLIRQGLVKLGEMARSHHENDPDPA